MSQTTVCSICGSEAALIHNGTRDNPGIDVYECSQCHTKFLGCIANNDYENGFMNGGKYLSPEEITGRLEACEADDLRRAGMVWDWCRDKDVLDFGCGFGGFLSKISHVARTVAGVELGRAEVEYLNNRGFRVEKNIDSYCEGFDVITVFHVFEHLAEPREWLSSFARFLRKGGRLFIEVPNANDALLSLYQSESFADFTYWSAHLYLYTQETLTKLIEENGSYVVETAEQLQRYPLSNHLYWLAKGGGATRRTACMGLSQRRFSESRIRKGSCKTQLL